MINHYPQFNYTIYFVQFRVEIPGPPGEISPSMTFDAFHRAPSRCGYRLEMQCQRLEFTVNSL